MIFWSEATKGVWGMRSPVKLQFAPQGRELSRE